MVSHSVLGWALLPFLFPIRPFNLPPDKGESAVKRPYSYFPRATGSALAPITLPAPSTPLTSSEAKLPTLITITARDLDTYRTKAGTTEELPDPSLTCVPIFANWPASRPTLRGITADALATWDIVAAEARYVPSGKPQPNRIYINVYAVLNKHVRGNPAPHDPPIVFGQVLVLSGAAGAIADSEASGSAARQSRYDIAKQDIEELIRTVPTLQEREKASHKLRAKLEKVLTKEQKTSLINGEYISLKIGEMPTALQTEAREYIRAVSDSKSTPELFRGPSDLDQSDWQNCALRFLPAGAGVASRFLGIVVVTSGGTEVYL